MMQDTEDGQGRKTELESSGPEGQPVDADRREALRKIGYTTPALLGLLATSDAARAT